LSNYRARHPGPAEVVLLIEVADTSSWYDSNVKATLYAQAEVAEYWVVLVETQEIIVHRGPIGGRYETVTRFGVSEKLATLAMPESYMSLDQIFGLN
jgi:Uma2 family endonuclease